MKGTLEVVTGAGGVAAPAEGGDDAAADHSGHDAMDYQKMTDDMLATMTAFPAETEGKGNAVLEPTEVRAARTKVFDLTLERSEARSVGKESVSTCRSRWSP